MKNVPIRVPGPKNPLTDEAAAIIRQLNLIPHPEGGWYREAYRSEEMIAPAALPFRYTESHCFQTSIYFLLESNDFSAFHRIRSDETWHFYIGSPVTIYIISEDGELAEIVMGNNLADSQLLQHTIKRNCWFAAKVLNIDSYALVGCTVSPGFEFDDFELGERQQLLKLYPSFSNHILALTHY